MKLTKRQGLCCAVIIVVFAIYSVFLFLLPKDKNLVFWLGYVFTIYSVVLLLVSTIKYLEKAVEEDRFLNMPVLVLSWIYIIGQFYLSYREISDFLFSYTVTLIVNLLVGFVFTVLILIVASATNKIAVNDKKVIEKIQFIDTVKMRLKSIDSDDVSIRKKIDRLIDDITYSDPMSHSRLSEIENNILKMIDEISGNLSDVHVANDKCDELSKLIKNRNEQCLSLKKVKDIPNTDNDTYTGNKTAVVGVGVALGIILLVATLVLYIVPEIKYKEACNLINEGKFEDAKSAFKDLGNFKDSQDKIAEIETIKKDRKYENAIQLMEDAKYPEAINAFSELNGYKDSKEKINEIGQLIFSEKYEIAEKAFSEGDYDTALSLYKEMIPYKDSRDRIVEIKNRCSSEDIIYLGTYGNEAVAWKIVEYQDNEKVLLLAEKSIRNLPISDNISSVSYEESDLAKWLNEDFVAQFTERDLSKIIENNRQKAFLLTESEVERLKNNGVDLTAEFDWWIRTESDIGYKYVSSDGTISDAGDIHLREKGVRPALWINLK